MYNSFLTFAKKRTFSTKSNKAHAIIQKLFRFILGQMLFKGYINPYIYCYV